MTTLAIVLARMGLPAWIASFVYLAAVSAWVTTAVKEDDAEAPPGPFETARRALPFFLMIVLGMIAFGLVVLGVQRFL